MKSKMSELTRAQVWRGFFSAALQGLIASKTTGSVELASEVADESLLAYEGRCSRDARGGFQFSTALEVARETHLDEMRKTLVSPSTKLWAVLWQPKDFARKEGVEEQAFNQVFRDLQVAMKMCAAYLEEEWEEPLTREITWTKQRHTQTWIGVHPSDEDGKFMVYPVTVR